MIQYIVLVIAFQLLFLIIYDLFLKKETFFQWNRVYLIGTFLGSLLLPFVKLSAFKTVMPQQFSAIVLDEIILTANQEKLNMGTQFSWFQILFIIGTVVSFLLFTFKIYQIVRLKKQGEIHKFSDYIKVIIPKSNNAFSFYNTVFMGDAVKKENEEVILEHELVHIKQKHTIDLLFFEVMRIALWFNPLVYIYQSRVSEVHEFIADAKVAKTHRKEQYNLLLSQVFQTENLSFVNHFFRSSLIKKRIKMLQKNQSKKIWASKYLLVLPTIICILFYTSSKGQEKETNTQQQEVNVANTEIKQNKNNKDHKKELTKAVKANLIRNDKVATDKLYQDAKEVPFLVIEEVPVFPGCEDAEDKRACFNKKLNEHIKKHFRYPDAAQKAGVQGMVLIRFVIQEDGSIGDIQMRGPDKMLEEEALRIIKLLPNVAPGKQKGKIVRVPFSLPITFRLQ